MKKTVIYLIAGIILTLVALVTATPVMDSIFSGQMEFANEMYNDNLYFMTTLFAVIIAWVLGAVYYYVINSVSFSRWYHWMIVLVAGALLSAIVCFVYCNGVFDTNGVDYADELFGYSVTNLFQEALLFIIVSFSIRWWSSNCRHTPIPE